MKHGSSPEFKSRGNGIKNIHVSHIMDIACAKTQRLENDDPGNCKLMGINKYEVCRCRVGSSSEKQRFFYIMLRRLDFFFCK